MADRAVCVIAKDENILVIFRRKAGREYYVFTGGSVEAGESPEDAAKRETLEELGLEVRIEKPLFEIDNNDRHEYWFLATPLTDKHPVLGEPEKLRQSAENVYEPMWINTKKLFNMRNVYPEEAVTKLKSGNLFQKFVLRTNCQGEHKD